MGCTYFDWRVLMCIIDVGLMVRISTPHTCSELLTSAWFRDKKLYTCVMRMNHHASKVLRYFHFLSTILVYRARSPFYSHDWQLTKRDPSFYSCYCSLLRVIWNVPFIGERCSKRCPNQSLYSCRINYVLARSWNTRTFTQQYWFIECTTTRFVLWACAR